MHSLLDIVKFMKKIIAIIFILLGVLIILYPKISNIIEEKNQTEVIKEYKKSLEVKNFNSVVELLSELIKNGKQVLGLIQMIYSFASLFTA